MWNAPRGLSQATSTAGDHDLKSVVTVCAAFSEIAFRICTRLGFGASLIAVFGGSHSNVFSEQLKKSLIVLESHQKRDLLHGVGGGVEKRLRRFDAIGVQKMCRGVSNGLFEERAEVNGGETDVFCKIFDGEIGVGIVVGNVLQRQINVVGVGGRRGRGVIYLIGDG